MLIYLFYTYLFYTHIKWAFSLKSYFGFFFFLSQKGDREKQNEDIKKNCYYLQTLCHPKDCILHGILQANTGAGSCSFLHRIFPIQELNSGVLHCRKILFQLSHQGSPRILEWVLSLFLVTFLTQELNWGLLHCRQMSFCQLSYQGSPN